MNFASDNTAGAAPEIMAALARAAEGFAPSYGADDHTKALEERLGEVFEKPCKAFAVATGTAANALALAACAPPWGAILCHENAHINEDECGAPEWFIGGAKLVPVSGADGRIAPEALARALEETGSRGVHQHQLCALSLTNLTERGTAYDPAQMRALAGAARGRGLKVHLDGARFANALAGRGCSAADLSWRAGVDILSLGATKNGCFMAEAIVVFDEALAETLAFRRKKAGHLLSKMRFVSAQMAAWLEAGLWLRLAGRANAAAAELADILKAAGAEILHPVEGNIVFASLPLEAHRRLRAAGGRYYLDPPWLTEDGEKGRAGGRFVCSFATTAAHLEATRRALRA